jgi:NAD-dependent DNA ligase
MLLDSYCLKITKNKNMLVPFYLMAAYAYYINDDPIISDVIYDHMAKELLKNYDDIHHHHKYLINKEQLEAGTCLIKYPTIIKNAVESLKNEKNRIS